MTKFTEPEDGPPPTRLNRAAESREHAERKKRLKQRLKRNAARVGRRRSSR